MVSKKPSLEDQVKQHAIILAAIAEYVEDLQAKGILPKPEPKTE